MSVLVSISCITYNHEKYIAQAIESFLMQKTDFEYEVLIHDDASTDGTADIIREYESKYPDIIKPIYQTENQYSKGISMNATFNWPRAQGKYIAMCEGDDYWTDPLKLQKQVDFMEIHPGWALCFHAAEIIRENGEKTSKFVRPNIGDKLFTAREIVVLGGGGFHTGAMLFRKNIIDNLPNWYLNASVGDYPLMLTCALNGPIFYIDQIMSNYRMDAIGSWSITLRYNEKRRLSHNLTMIDMLNEFNSASGKEFETELLPQIDQYKVGVLFIQRNKDCFKNHESKRLFRSLSFSNKIRFLLRLYAPRFHGFLSKIKYRLSNE